MKNSEPLAILKMRVILFDRNFLTNREIEKLRQGIGPIRICKRTFLAPFQLDLEKMPADILSDRFVFQMNCIMRINGLNLIVCFVLINHAGIPAMAQAPAKKKADETPPGKVYIYKKSGGVDRQMEIYFPPGHDPAKAKVPGLIMFHGGGWTGGTPAQFRRACEYFASRGMVTATVSYRMLKKNEIQALPPGESHKRACIIDAKSAIRWFKQHADELGIDPLKIVTGGGSAGGHISTLATTNPGLNDPADDLKTDTSVVAYLLFNPAFTADDAKDSEINALKHLKASFAPAIVFFGTEDNWKKGWDAAEKQLMQSGNKTTEVLLAKGLPHGFFNREPWQSLTLIAADSFLVEQGLLKGSPTLKTPKTDLKLEAAK